MILLPHSEICQLVATSVYIAAPTYSSLAVETFSVSSEGTLTRVNDGYPPHDYSATVMASPITFSHDGAHVYVALPSVSVSSWTYATNRV